MAIILGSFIFTDYAIPEKVALGGEQRLVIHKLIGGARVIDAMGQDDSDITWHGRFQGPNSTPNAMTLDMMRKSGGAVPLIIDAQFYSVVVRKFEWDYERPYQILYKITCTVISSPGGPSALTATLDGIIAADMQSAAAYFGLT